MALPDRLRDHLCHTDVIFREMFRFEIAFSVAHTGFQKVAGIERGKQPNEQS